MILFVDDDDYLLAGYRRSLSRHFAIDTASGGAAGLEMIRSGGPYAVIVSDIEMPVMNGVAFLKEANRLSPDSVKLALSGQDDRNLVIDMINEGGIFRYLTKPIAHEALREALETAVARFLERQQRHHAAPLERQRFIELGRHLGRAVAAGEMFVLYQPQVDLIDGTVRGVEALIRWRHPSLGVVPPDEFIPVAEINGAIVPLTRWLIRRACRDIAAWRDAGLRQTVSLNVSMAHFEKLDLVDSIQRAVAEAGVDAECLEIEVTESVLDENTDRLKAGFERLRQIGVGIALDDFGSGFMRYEYLRQLPIRKLKIDGSLVRSMEQEKPSAAIVESLIAASLSMGIAVVAEAVETPGQVAMLRRMGCHLGQGYHFARPMPAEELIDWIRDHAVAPDMRAAPTLTGNGVS